MVRRRPRATKTAGSNCLLTNGTDGATAVAATMVNKNLLEDQYFASPKRKDCKIDNNLSGDVEVIEILLETEPKKNVKTKSTNHGKTRGGIAGRTIGVPLATRSQTRTIENFFKAKTAADNAKLYETEDKKTCNTPITKTTTTNILEDHSSPRKHSINGLDPELVVGDCLFELSEDTNDTDHTDISEEGACGAGAIGGNTSDFFTHRSSLRDSHSSHSSATENIFLQEPVLTLNVDKTPNQASSIKINKSFEAEPVFSSPPSITSTFNGRFNQIVSLNGISQNNRDSLSFDAKLAEGLQLPDNDNSSCDSGVAIGSSLDSTPMNGLGGVVNALHGAVSRRRKPTTPHRIVCPSPVKAVARITSPAGGLGGASSGGANRSSPSGRKFGASSKEILSPRKSPRHLVAAAASKTRRRLNQHKEQAPYMTTGLQSKQNGHIVADDDEDIEPISLIDGDDDDHRTESENLEQRDEVNECCGGGLNGITSVTAQKLLNSSTNADLATTATIQHTSTAQKSTTTASAVNTNNNNNNNNNIRINAPSKLKSSAANGKSQSAKLKSSTGGLQQPLALTNGNREVTEFFQVRRSVRKTKTAVKEEMMRNLEQAILEEREEGLKVDNFDGKGRGVVAARRFQRGEFVVEYIGELISISEASEREKRYAQDQNAGCYMYYFKHKNQQYCIDATVDTGKMGRLVNHSRNGNLITKVVVVKQRPHLVLIAKDDIEVGEELTYDYGDRSKLSLLHHPWLAF